MQRQQICYEDIAIGDAVPSLVKGPLTTAHALRWSAAMENWHKIHYDRPFTIEHEKLPGLLVAGSLKQQFVVQVLKDWVAPHGWVWRVQFQFRAMSLVGETLTAWARVTGKRATAHYGLVDLDIGIVNASGVESTPGSACVALPFAGGAPVTYPFEPPADC